MTQLSGHAAADTHRRLSRAVAALRAFSRRRAGRPAAVPSSSSGVHGIAVGIGGNAAVGGPPVPPPAPPAPSSSRQNQPPAADAAGESGGGVPVSSTPAAASAARQETAEGVTAASPRTGVGSAAAADDSSDFPAASAASASVARNENEVVDFSPLATFQAPLLAIGSGGGSYSSSFDPSEERQSTAEGTSALSSVSGYGTAGAPGGGGGVYNSGSSSGSSDRRPLMQAWAAAEAAAEATKAAERASAAAEAAAMSAAASASVAAEGAVIAEHNNIAKALEEIRGALLAGREDAAGAGAEVERVAAGVGLAPALLRALRALRRRDDDGGGGGGGGRSSGLRLAKEV